MKLDSYLGILYNYGQGTKKDLEKAIYWYNKSAKNENKYAIFNLSACYELGIAE